jgi:hypothetical protein
MNSIGGMLHREEWNLMELPNDLVDSDKKESQIDQIIKVRTFRRRSSRDGIVSFSQLMISFEHL